jgi:hypothetical protein
VSNSSFNIQNQGKLAFRSCEEAKGRRSNLVRIKKLSRGFLVSDQITNSPSADESVSYIPNPAAARLIAALIQTGYFPSSIPDCMTGYWPLALADIQTVADKSERERFQTFSAFTVDLPKEQSWGMMFEVRTFLLPKVNRTEKDRQLFWAKDAMSPPPELEWVVPGLFARPSLNILVGDPGSKKTYLAMDLAICISNGIPWLSFSAEAHQSEPLAVCESKHKNGENNLEKRYSAQPSSLLPRCEATQGSATPKAEKADHSFSSAGSPQPKKTPVPVLFIDEESGYLQMWSRFNSVLHAHNSDPGTPLAYTSLAGYKLNDPEDTDALIKRALSMKAGLIIIDALSDLLSAIDSNGSIQTVLFNLRRLSDTCHAAVVIIHHTNREGGYRGSSSIAAAVDLMLEITSPPADNLITIRTLKSRFQSPDPFYALAHFATTSEGNPRFNLSVTKPPVLASPSPLSSSAGEGLGVRGAILNFLSTHPNSTRAKITNALPEYAEGTIRNALKELRADTMVHITDETINQKSPEYVLSQNAIAILTQMELSDVKLDKK